VGARPSVVATPSLKANSVEATPFVVATPSVISNTQEAQTGGSASPPSEEQSTKEVVLDYMRTMSSDEDPAVDRFFAGRVNFYGKGVLSLEEVQESIERYRKEWPIRRWEPRGEPTFSKIFHSTRSELYEVLQPFDWTVANGSERKKGNATLYIRVRKNNNGQFHITHLEMRP
jgi:hypothetical protein